VRPLAHHVAGLIRDQRPSSEETAQRARTRINRELVMARAGRDTSGFRVVFGRCESLIEQKFCLALFRVAGVVGRAGFFPEILQAGPDQLFVHAQEPIDGIPVDFLLVAPQAPPADAVFLIIECDAAGYRSADEQRAAGAVLQRLCKKYGFQLLRFTGLEIDGSPRAVIVRTLTACGWDPARSAHATRTIAFREIDLYGAFSEMSGWQKPAEE
jgi:very-short-patch-repair endonuclease